MQTDQKQSLVIVGGEVYRSRLFIIAICYTLGHHNVLESQHKWDHRAQWHRGCAIMDRHHSLVRIIMLWLSPKYNTG